MADDYKEILKKRFAELHPLVQQAITSADVEAHMRELANVHKLHVDQWDSLANEVMLALLGFQPVEELQGNIQKHVGTSPEVAVELTTSIMKVVFEPIREELERELGHPKAKDESVSDMEKVREEVLSDAPKQIATENVQNDAIQSAEPTPSTPPAEKPSFKVEIGPASGGYKPGETSDSRRDVADDPYREPPE